MARSIFPVSPQLVQVVVLLVVFCSFLVSTTGAKAGQGPAALEFYVHETRTPPASLILVSPDFGGDLSGRRFGSIIVIDNQLRLTNETTSELIGRQLGQVAIGSDNMTFYVSYTLMFNSTSYSGSINVAGVLQSGTLSISGGTGSFAYARGLAFPSVVSDTGVAAVYKYNLELKY